MEPFFRRFSRENTLWRSPFLLGLLSIATSGVFASLIDRMENERAEAAFLQTSSRLVSAVQNRMSSYGDGLRRAHAFSGVSANQPVEFLRYMQFLDLASSQPGALSIGLVRQVSEVNRTAYQAKWASDFSNISLRMASVSSLNTDAYIIEALEPGIFKVDVRGYDFSTDHAVVSDLIWAIRKDKEVIVSSSLFSSLHHADFFVFSPWYRFESRINKFFDRQGTLQGFIYAPVSAAKMMESINLEYGGFIEYKMLIAGLPNKHPYKIYESRFVNGDKNEVEKIDSLFNREVIFDYGGKKIKIIMKSRPEFEIIYKSNNGLWIFIFGLIISMGGGYVFYIIINVRNSYLQLRDQLEKKKENEIFLALSEVGSLVLKINQQGQILNINEAAQKLFKLTAADVCGKNICCLFLDLSSEILEKNIQSCMSHSKNKTEYPPLVLNGVDYDGDSFSASLSFYFFAQNKIIVGVLAKPALIEDKEKIIIKERLNLAINAAHLGIWDWWLEENEIHWDETMYSFYGLDAISFNVNYANWSGRIVREDIVKFDGAVHAMLHGGESLCEVVRITRADGSIRYISMHGKLILNEKDHAERVIGINFDITSLKEAEHSLRESGERFSLAAQAAKEGIWDWNMQTGEVWFSSQWKENFGYQDDELENNLATWDYLIDPEDRKRFLRLTHEFNQSMSDRFEVTLRFKHKAGHWVSVRSRAVHLKNESGDVVRMVGSHEDITEILKHEEALNESRKRMDLTIQCAGLGIWDWNIVTNEVLFGGQWAEMLGYELSEIKHNINSWSGLTHPDDLVIAGQVLQAHFDGKTPTYSAEFRMRAKDGSWRWILGVGRVNAFGPRGEPLRILGVNIDIHARKMNEDALQAATLLAEAASRAKSEFLANMSHEIRTPLNAVLGFSALLQESKLNPQQRDLIDSIHTAGNSLLAIVNDLLDFSKIEAGRLELDCVALDLRQLCEEALFIGMPKAYLKNLEIACVVAPSVPERVLGDPVRVKQILLNLMNNAIKFTVSGHIVIRVSSEALDNQQALIRVQVKDTGLGISEQLKSELFRPFTQADNSMTRKFGGTGLGLSICKRLIEAMEGRIGVESLLGEGAEFWFEIPFNVTDAEPPAPVQNEHPSNRVLVLDLFAAHAESLQMMLGRLGLAADCYTDLEQGLAALEQLTEVYILVIIDARYEQIAGQNHRIRAIAPQVPLIYLGHPMIDDGYRAAHPLAFFLAKPASERQLRHCIEGALHIVESAPIKVKQLLAQDIERLNLHILVAEDNPINQKVVMMMLQKLACKVDVACNGLEALNAVQKGHYDLVFMDCQMPEMDGYTSVALIRSLSGKQSQVPIVALTANAFKVDEERCYAVGMNDFIAKPITAEHLIRVLSRFFSNQLNEQVTIAQSGDPMISSISPEEIDKEMASINHTFEDLKTMLGMDMTDELIQLFLPTLDECLANLGAVIESGDGDAVVNCAHKLKGAAAQLGAQSLADLCKKVEQTGREKELNEAWPFHAKIISLGRAVGQRLRERQN
ncbi:PAS domain-containing protein [Iodobacter arcticus]|uniref:histidine kinase n=1 Tax=Iodobacter arcticus TaxID=590593 RepID=A0ABW2QWQ8_9NEIS